MHKKIKVCRPIFPLCVYRKEFDSHGIGEHVTVTFNDVLKNGYFLENIADAGEPNTNTLVVLHFAWL